MKKQIGPELSKGLGVRFSKLVFGFACIFFLAVRGSYLWSIFKPTLQTEKFEVTSSDVNNLWYGKAQRCFSETMQTIESSTISLPFANTDYLIGFKTVVNNPGTDSAYPWLRQSFINGNETAAVLLWFAQTNGKDRVRNSDNLPLTLTESSLFKFYVAEYYLGLAASCHINGQIELARKYRDLGVLMVPAGMEVALGVELNRRVGALYYGERRWEEAVPWLWRAVPGDESPLLQLSHILFEQKKYEEALPIFRRALLFYPDRMETRVMAARAADQLGRHGEALEFLDEIKQPANLRTDELLFWANLCLESDDSECASDKYRTVLKRDSSHSVARDRLEQLMKNRVP